MVPGSTSGAWCSRRVWWRPRGVAHGILGRGTEPGWVLAQMGLLHPYVTTTRRGRLRSLGVAVHEEMPMTIRFDPRGPYEVEERDVPFARPQAWSCRRASIAPKEGRPRPRRPRRRARRRWTRLDRTSASCTARARRLRPVSSRWISVKARTISIRRAAQMWRRCALGARERARAPDRCRQDRLTGHSSGGHLALLVSSRPARGAPGVPSPARRIARRRPPRRHGRLRARPLSVTDPIARYRYVLGRQAEPASPGGFDAQRLINSITATSRRGGHGRCQRHPHRGRRPRAVLPPVWLASPSSTQRAAAITDAFVEAYERRAVGSSASGSPARATGSSSARGGHDRCIALMRDFIGRQLGLAKELSGEPRVADAPRHPHPHRGHMQSARRPPVGNAGPWPGWPTRPATTRSGSRQRRGQAAARADHAPSLHRGHRATGSPGDGRAPPRLANRSSSPINRNVIRSPKDAWSSGSAWLEPALRRAGVGGVRHGPQAARPSLEGAHRDLAHALGGGAGDLSGRRFRADRSHIGRCPGTTRAPVLITRKSGEMLAASFDRFGRLGDGIITTYVHYDECRLVREAREKALARYDRPARTFPSACTPRCGWRTTWRPPSA